MWVSSCPPRYNRRPAEKGHPQGVPLQPAALAKARAAYQEFLMLWKDADPDIPILKEAKAEQTVISSPR